MDLLKLTDMTDCAPVRTPIDPNVKLGEGGDSPPVNHYQYQQLVGKLIYLTHAYTTRHQFCGSSSQSVHACSARDPPTGRQSGISIPERLSWEGFNFSKEY